MAWNGSTRREGASTMAGGGSQQRPTTTDAGCGAARDEAIEAALPFLYAFQVASLSPWDVES
jgi:hypothetical protein